MTTVTRSIEFAVKGGRTRAAAAPSAAGAAEGGDARPAADAATNAAEGRVPRVSMLMALAIRFQRLLDEGVVASQSELAELAHITQPRMTQIMNLLHLAPDIQEEILFLPPVAEGRDPVTERDLRGVAAIAGWGEQRRAWATIGR
jgi:hypothetical protein